ncbi:hypothetical protein ODZ84_06130 [Chryseobacterium fluminis]|uniref:hypothetical protein n=1 Tax=Chryseobacterium fluminis TaxID=2983606 RepID=UPI00225B6286|nr:hypothetical protein [Chryseobacterium sp. MMS21-Ot14]UZT99145.1 hypothetical protein ODZ84_06130 [Chryseobacterium sp. MMS21-Ot14]
MKYSETVITMSDGERYSRHSKDLQIILIKKTMPINQMPPDGGMLYKETDMAQFFHRYRTNPFVWLSDF